MYKRFVELLARNGERAADVSRATGIAYSTFSDWKAGRSTPKTEKLQKIADHFDVSLEYLMTGIENESFVSDRERQLLDHYRLLSDADRDAIDRYAQVLSESLEKHHSA